MKIFLLIAGSIIGLNVFAFGVLWIIFWIERRREHEHGGESGRTDHDGKE